MARVGKEDAPFVHHSEGYNKLSLFQRNIIQIFLPHVTTAARALNGKRDDSSFVVVDYGAADGINSVPMIARCLGKYITSYATVVLVPATYYAPEALASGEFKVEWVFNDLFDVDNETYIHQVEDRLHQISGWKADSAHLQYLVGNFYQQVMPAESVDLGVCVSAAHWLSQRPPVGCNKDPPYPDETTKRIAAKDWVDFLHSRAQELKPGGRLAVLIGDSSPLAVKAKEFIIVGPQQVIKDMFNEGIITKEEYEYAQIFTISLRTVADIKAPFLDPEFGLCQTLQLIDIKTYHVPDPFYVKWKAAGGRTNTSATEEFIMDHVNFTKTFYNSFWAVLEVTRSREVHAAILETFYRRVGEMVREDLEGYHASVSVTVLDIIKD